MQTQLIFCVHKQKIVCPKYFASHLSLRNLGFRNLGARNPVPKQEKNPVLGTYFFSRQPPRKISAATHKITSKGAD